MNFEIAIIGTGKLAHVLGQSLNDCGHSISCIYGRSSEKLKELSLKLNPANTTTSYAAIPDDADFYIVLVSDDAISDVADHLPDSKGIVLHCSGNTPLSVLSAKHKNHGVLYLLDSFTSSNSQSLSDTPVLIEYNNNNTRELLNQLAKTLSNKVLEISSEKRSMVHLAAVFANNFTIHLQTTAKQILKEHQIPEDILNKLIHTTYLNSLKTNPSDFQTGPAVRNDIGTIKDHLLLLKNDPTLTKLYQDLSRSINHHLTLD